MTKMKNTKHNYEVYVASLDGEVLYVGSGAKGRHTHCNSGISSCYELNLIHHCGGKVHVDVFEVKDKQESLQKEAQLIQELKPSYNKELVSDVRKRLNSICSGRYKGKNLGVILESISAKLDSKGYIFIKMNADKKLYDWCRKYKYQDRKFQNSLVESMSQVLPRLYKVKISDAFLQNPLLFLEGVKETYK